MHSPLILSFDAQVHQSTTSFPRQQSLFSLIKLSGPHQSGPPRGTGALVWGEGIREERANKVSFVRTIVPHMMQLNHPVGVAWFQLWKEQKLKSIPQQFQLHKPLISLSQTHAQSTLQTLLKHTLLIVVISQAHTYWASLTLKRYQALIITSIKKSQETRVWGRWEILSPVARGLVNSLRNCLMLPLWLEQNEEGSLTLVEGGDKWREGVEEGGGSGGGKRRTGRGERGGRKISVGRKRVRMSVAQIYCLLLVYNHGNWHHMKYASQLPCVEVK